MVRKLLAVLQGTHFLILNLSEVAKTCVMCTSFYAQRIYVACCFCLTLKVCGSSSLRSKKHQILLSSHKKKKNN